MRFRNILRVRNLRIKLEKTKEGGLGVRGGGQVAESTIQPDESAAKAVCD